MSGIATQPEVIKLGRTLNVAPETLEFLGDIPADELRALRVAVYELMFSKDRELFRRLGRVSRRLPVWVVSMLAERVFGPLVAARVVAEMPSRRAAGISMRTSTVFVANVCVYLDPRRTHEVIRQLPTDRVVEIVRELVDRGDYITISRFVDFLPEEAIRAAVDAIEDEGAMLRIAFFMGSKNRLDHLFRMLPRDRVEATILLVADESQDLLVEFLSLLIHVSYARKRELGDLAAAQGEEVLTGYVRGTQDEGLWPDMLPVVAAMSDAARRKVVNLPILKEPAVQESIVRAADEKRLWGVVLPMVALGDDEHHEVVAGIIANRPPETLEKAADAALMGEHWEPLLDLMRRMPAPKQEELAGIVRKFGEVDPDLLSRIVRRADAFGLGARFDGASAPSLS